MMKGDVELGGEPHGSGVPTTTKGAEEADPACASWCLFSPLPFLLRTLAKASLTPGGRELLQSMGMLLDIGCLSCPLRSGLA